MSLTTHTGRPALPAALTLTFVLTSSLPAAFVFDDIAFWVGEESASAHRAALVVDWGDGSPGSSFAWGFRWPAGESRTGQDMVSAIAAADPRLDIGGLDTGFLENFAFEPEGAGGPSLFHPGYVAETGAFWNYLVNNGVEDGNFTPSGHLLPPDAAPYAPTDPGTWNLSNTGVADRPLADGSWDGFVYAPFGARLPAEPLAATPVPEPTTTFWLAAATIAACLRRRVRPRR